jgi:hypothetical protein
MITMLDLLPPSTTISYVNYIPATQVDWMHSSKREWISEEQYYPSSGPASVIPTAIFTIVETGTPNVWLVAEW